MLHQLLGSNAGLLFRVDIAFRDEHINNILFNPNSETIKSEFLLYQKMKLLKF